MLRFRRSWITITGLVTILSITGLTFFGYAPTDNRRWLALGLLVIFAFVHLLDLKRIAPRRTSLPAYLLLVTLTVINIGLFWCAAEPLSVVILFFVLSVHAMEALPTRHAYGWIVLFGFCTIVMLATMTEPAVFGVLHGFAALGGYFFLGLAANAQRRAEQANDESQRLLKELQVAHRQLRQHAMQAEELAISRERNRLAREVHDTLGHRLTVAAVQLEGAQKLIAHNPNKAVSMVATVHEQVREGLSELRQTVAALRIPMEEALPLPKALAHLVTHFEQATGIPTHLTLPVHPLDLAAEYRQALYRTVQEALTNVQKHAQAQTVAVCLDQCVKASGCAIVQVTIDDDGVGMPAADNRKGFGLHGLQERAEQLSGCLRIDTSPMGGTRIILHLPMSQ